MPPAPEDLALYAMGHFEGDAGELERWLEDAPDARAQLAAEADLECVLRDMARAATFCAACHDLVRGDRCASCGVALSTPASADVDHARAARAASHPGYAVPIATPVLARRSRLSAPALFAVTAIAVALISVVLLGTRPRSVVSEAPAVAPALPAERPTEPRSAIELPGLAAPRRSPPAPTAPTASPTKPAPAVPRTRTPSPAIVELRITTQPAGVVVRLDHEELGLTPIVVKLKRRSAPLELRLQHIGYHELVKHIALTTDTRLSLWLTSRGGPIMHEDRFTDAQCMQCHRPSTLTGGAASRVIRDTHVRRNGD